MCGLNISGGGKLQVASNNLRWRRCAQEFVTVLHSVECGLQVSLSGRLKVPTPFWCVYTFRTPMVDSSRLRTSTQYKYKYLVAGTIKY